MTEVTIDNLENIPSNQLTADEADKLEGSKPKIASVNTEEYDTRYGVDSKLETYGNELPNGETMKAWRVVAETELFGEAVIGRNITVKEYFNLKLSPSTGNWGPSLHEKSKAKQLFVKLSVKNFKEVPGNPITILKKVGNNDRVFLTFGI